MDKYFFPQCNTTRGTAYLQNRMTSVVSPGLLVLLEAQTCHNFYRSATSRSSFLVVLIVYTCIWSLFRQWDDNKQCKEQEKKEEANK